MVSITIIGTHCVVRFRMLSRFITTTTSKLEIFFSFYITIIDAVIIFINIVLFHLELLTKGPGKIPIYNNVSSLVSSYSNDTSGCFSFTIFPVFITVS